jgi:hypothetical protein
MPDNLEMEEAEKALQHAQAGQLSARAEEAERALLLQPTLPGAEAEAAEKLAILQAVQEEDEEEPRS